MNMNTDRDEDKVKAGESKSEGELLGQKLKRGLLVVKRGCNSTPSPTWKFGIIQPDGTLIQDLNFNTEKLSARKLGANLWEMEPQLNNIRVGKVSKSEPSLKHHHKEDAPANEQPTTSIRLRKQFVESQSPHNLRVKRVVQAQRPLSSASYCSSMEMAPYRPVVSPNRSLLFKGKTADSNYGLKTSTELLKVLNRIWSLEEKHALDMSLVRTLKRELEQSQSRVQELLQDKKKDQNEINNLNKKITGYKAAVELVEDKLDEEHKSKKHSEKVSNKLAKEILEIKFSLSNSLKELERERKARGLLEDLCDEFAKGIKNYEQEIHIFKQKSGNDHHIETDGHDRLILHVSEAWLDERAQMKSLEASHDVSALDKLCNEIEAFLHAKEQNVKNESKHSLEMLHLDGPTKDDESVSIGNRCSQFCRGMSSKQGSKSRREDLRERMRSSMGEDVITRNPSVALEDMKFGHEMDTFDPSRFTGPPSPVKKWTSDVSGAGNLDICESSSRGGKSVKRNTLKAKLIEARIEGQESRASRARASKS